MLLPDSAGSAIAGVSGEVSHEDDCLGLHVTSCVFPALPDTCLRLSVVLQYWLETILHTQKAS